MRRGQCTPDRAGAPATTPMKPTIIAATAARDKARTSGHQLCITCISKLSYKARMSLLVPCQNQKNHSRIVAGTRRASALACWLQPSKRPTSRVCKRPTSRVCKRPTSRVCKRPTSRVCMRPTSRVCMRPTSRVCKRPASRVCKLQAAASFLGHGLRTGEGGVCGAQEGPQRVAQLHDAQPYEPAHHRAQRALQRHLTRTQTPSPTDHVMGLHIWKKRGGSLRFPLDAHFCSSGAE